MREPQHGHSLADKHMWFCNDFSSKQQKQVVERLAFIALPR